MMEQICLLHHLTPDKKEIKDFPKSPSATSFIRKPLYKISNLAFRKVYQCRNITYKKDCTY